MAKILRDYPPRLLFLSGCSTGKSDNVHEAESFAHQLVAAGVPVVLGWGLPVSDVGATRLTAELYRYLAQGKSVDFAVQRARQEVASDYHPWPLLRVFTDGSPLAPLVTPGQRLQRRNRRQTTYKTLQHSQVKVLEYGFVGRRREIQRGVRVLKGFEDYDGVLIHGAAGVGKSCLAGKLIERLPEKKLLVLHGKLKRPDLIVALRCLFDQHGITSGLEVLKEDIEFADKMKALLREPLKEMPTLIVLDDFEQNLIRQGEQWWLTEDATEIVKPLLQALSWSEGGSPLIITSRYPFVLEDEGQDLPKQRLAHISLMSFRGPDLEKKKQELPKIAKSAHSALYLEFGHGNPRLLDWLEKIAEDEEHYDLDALKAQLQGKNEEYIRDYLADIIAAHQGEAFQHFLQRAVVFRQPVPPSAFETWTDHPPLEQGVNLTLLEKEQSAGQAPVYWVTPVIREQTWQRLNPDDQLPMHRRAYQWYDGQIKADEESTHPDYLEEAVHHALAADDIPSACKHAIILGEYWWDLLLYRERLQLQQGVADRVDENIIQQAIAAQDENVSALLNELGVTWRNLGYARKAIDYFEQALQIDRAVFGDQHPNVAGSYNNLGLAWRDLGDTEKAIEYLSKALTIRTAYDANHAHTQRVQSRLDELKQKSG